MDVISVVIPAHNEERVIARSVQALTSGAPAGELEMVVVCNGCSDATAEMAHGLGLDMRVIETDVASKTNALNLGDAAVTGFPRIYVDADVILTYRDLAALAAGLGKSGALAASPSVQYDFNGSSRAVRAFYDIDRRLPSGREAIGGSGVYALSAEGRRRFETFPPIVADDAFVRRHFRADERVVVEDAVSVVTPPRNLAGLVKIKARSHYGNRELAERFPDLTENKGAGNGRVLFRLLLNPVFWPALAVYGFVKISARMRASRRWKAQGPYRWERDETSRVPRTNAEQAAM